MSTRRRKAVTGFLADFRDFILRGNVIDLAVAVVIGAAFTQIVNSLVADVITPALLNPALEAAGVKDLSQLTAGNIKYGSFLAAVLSFLVIAFCIFLLIRVVGAVKKRLEREAAAAPAPASADPVLVAQEKLIKAIEDLTQAIAARERD